jgi:hypothetical protein
MAGRWRIFEHRESAREVDHGRPQNIAVSCLSPLPGVPRLVGFPRAVVGQPDVSALTITVNG